MNIGIEFGITKIKNSNLEDVLKINDICNAIVDSINSKGVKTTAFRVVSDETILKRGEEKQVSKLNSVDMDLVICIDFNKDDSVSTGAYAYAIGEDETMIAKRILSNLSSMYENNGVRVGNGKFVLRGTNAKSIILSPFNLVNDIEKLNEIGLANVAENIANSIVSSLK